MKFGRVEHINAVDFTLPEDNPLTKEVLTGGKVENPMVHLGCPVWTDKGYLGKVYPEKTKSSEYLHHYTRQFNAVEVNATHYNIPSITTVAKWRNAATPGFKFSPKFPQSISHRKDFHLKTEVIDRFLETIYGLDEFLGMSFLQLPPYFKPTDIETLYLFLESLPEDFELAVEVRHEDWFLNQKEKAKMFELLHHFGVTWVITDTPGRRDVCHQVLTTNKAFIRFVGNDLHFSDFNRVDSWIRRIEDWMGKGLQEVYFYMHEPTKHLCADLAAHMINNFNELEGVNLKSPILFSNSKQQTLF